MKILFKTIFAFISVALLSGCSKKEEDPVLKLICDGMKTVHISTSKTTYTVGDRLVLSANGEYAGYIEWYNKVRNNTYGGDLYIIDQLSKTDEGWYYLNVHYPGCAEQGIDSVYIKIENKIEDIPCDVPSNTLRSNIAGTLKSTSIYWGIYPVENLKTLQVYNGVGLPEMYMSFNEYWNNNSLEPGVYNITQISNLKESTYTDKYSVSLHITYQSIRYTASSGKVYVSKNNSGKFVFKFCDLSLNGIWGGSSASMSGSGHFVQP